MFDTEFEFENKTEQKIEKPKAKEIQQIKKYYEIPRAWITKEFTKWNDKLKKQTTAIAIKNLCGDDSATENATGFWFSDMDLQICKFKQSNILTIIVDSSKNYFFANGSKQSIPGSTIIQALDLLFDTLFNDFESLGFDFPAISKNQNLSMFFNDPSALNRASLKMAIYEIYENYKNRKVI